ncbi:MULTISPECIES: hypothetical protein [unclassified Bosea (in: a-proteobacteria)]|nr:MULTISPECIES: hypothetical protein [unclassified Bosea (in: a-proteobacteria)]
MSVWQFMACADGYACANSPEAAKRTNDEPDFEDLSAMVDAAPTYQH